MGAVCDCHSVSLDLGVGASLNLMLLPGRFLSHHSLPLRPPARRGSSCRLACRCRSERERTFGAEASSLPSWCDVHSARLSTHPGVGTRSLCEA